MQNAADMEPTMVADAWHHSSTIRTSKHHLYSTPACHLTPALAGWPDFRARVPPCEHGAAVFIQSWSCRVILANCHRRHACGQHNRHAALPRGFISSNIVESGMFRDAQDQASGLTLSARHTPGWHKSLSPRPGWAVSKPYSRSGCQQTLQGNTLQQV